MLINSFNGPKLLFLFLKATNKFNKADRSIKTLRSLFSGDICMFCKSQPCYQINLKVQRWMKNRGENYSWDK